MYIKYIFHSLDYSQHNSVITNSIKNNSCSCDISLPQELGEVRNSEVRDSFENIYFSMSFTELEFVFTIHRQKSNRLMPEQTLREVHGGQDYSVSKKLPFFQE